MIDFTLYVDLSFFIRIQPVVSDIALSFFLMPRLVAHVKIHQKIRYDEVQYGANDNKSCNSEEHIKTLEPNDVF